MERETIHMLESLPLHLRRQGWSFCRAASRRVHARGAVRYIAVYERPYEPGTDNERLAAIVDGRVRVSTWARLSLSWRHAYDHALEAMEYVDSKRTPIASSRAGR